MNDAAWQAQVSKEAGEQLRDWIAGLGNARLAIVTEALMKRVLHVAVRQSKHHDLFDPTTLERVEVKFSVVRRCHKVKLTDETILQCIEESKDRMVPFSQYKKCMFDCNIQHIRNQEFDLLYYGLLFSDCLKLFKIEAPQINRHKSIHASHQTKGNSKERQFHIHADNLKLHLRRYLFKTLTYEEVLDILSIAP